MNADAVKDLIYQSCLAMDDERFDEYLSLCTEDYQYKVTTYSPELRKEMVWLEQSRTDLGAMFERYHQCNIAAEKRSNRLKGPRKCEVLQQLAEHGELHQHLGHYVRYLGYP